MSRATMPDVLEVVANVSEGRQAPVLDVLAAAAGPDLLDGHADPDHHRSVFTLLAGGGVGSLAVAAIRHIDLRRHSGAHPRRGAIDVVPFVPLGDAELGDALAARDQFADWLGEELRVPAFLYGPERSLPDVRREAFRSLAPDAGPSRPHPTAGACAVGARPILVAYNVWLRDPNLALARRVAAAVRGPAVLALGLRAGAGVQVSMNLLAPLEVGPAAVFDRVAALAPVARAELVGLVPRGVLEQTPDARWAELDLSPDRTIEARLAQRPGA